MHDVCDIVCVCARMREKEGDSEGFGICLPTDTMRNVVERKYSFLLASVSLGSVL